MGNRPTPLKRSADFEALRLQGQKFSRSRWLTAVFQQNASLGFRLGFTITKKVGTAVVRNRLKRWGREAVKRCLLQHEGWASKSVDINILIRPMPKGFYEKMDFAKYVSVMESTLASIFEG